MKIDPEVKKDLKAWWILIRSIGIIGGISVGGVVLIQYFTGLSVDTCMGIGLLIAAGLVALRLLKEIIKNNL